MTEFDYERILGIVLAGGLSRRMGGGDKCMIPIGGKPMLAHAIDRLSAQTGDLVVNANGDPGRFSAYQRTIVPDTIEGFAGPLAGVLAGLKWARQHRPFTTHVVSAASDTPFFPAGLVERLFSATAGDEAAIALAGSGGHRHPVFGLWPVALADDLETWLKTSDTMKVVVFADRHRLVDVTFDDCPGPGGLDPFFNANTPEDLASAEAALAESVS